MSELFTILISSLFAYLIAGRTAKSNENLALKQHLNEKKKDLYVNFFKLLTEVTIHKKKYNNTQLTKIMGDHRRDLMFYASKSVLKAFNEWSINSAREPEIMFPLLDKLLYEMRKDVGIDDLTWNKNELTRVQTLLTEDLNVVLQKKDSVNP